MRGVLVENGIKYTRWVLYVEKRARDGWIRSTGGEMVVISKPKVRRKRSLDI